jgi:two-component system alkaline phosphatase synthesis response regulator PhoP
VTKTILIVDDEKDIIDLLKYNLQKEGYHVLTAANGKQALDRAEQRPDLILLDVMMPEMDGLEVVKRLKANNATSTIPVIFLTAKGSEVDEIVGLELGADDYIVKPVRVPKLMARIKALLRKHEAEPARAESRVRRVGIVEIIPDKHLVRISKKEVFFPKKEFQILLYLASHVGSVVNRETLLNAVWGSDVYVVDRTVDVHIRKIREKLGKHADYIETIKGVGYRMKEIG